LSAQWQGLTAGALVVGGLVDGVNPCAFATLVLFMSLVPLSARRRQHLLSLSLSFIAGAFCAYFLIGLGLTEAVGLLVGVSLARVAVNYGIPALCLVLATLSVHDCWKARRGNYEQFVVQLPAWVKARMRLVMSRLRRARYLVLAGFVTGALISGLELVCTGQVYLPIIQLISMTSGTRTATLGCLLLHNASFIVPLAVAFLLVYFGTTSEALTDLLRRRLAAVTITRRQPAGRHGHATFVTAQSSSGCRASNSCGICAHTGQDSCSMPVSASGRSWRAKWGSARLGRPTRRTAAPVWLCCADPLRSQGLLPCPQRPGFVPRPSGLSLACATGLGLPPVKAATMLWQRFIVWLLSVSRSVRLCARLVQSSGIDVAPPQLLRMLWRSEAQGQASTQA